MFDLQLHLPYLLNRAGARLAVSFNRELRTRGVGLQEWRVIAVLAAHGAQNLSTLAVLTSIDLSTLSRLVGRMARSTLLSGNRNGADKREKRVVLTEKGLAVARAIFPTAHRYERTALRSMSASEARTLKRLLQRVYANLDRLDGD